MNTAKNLSVPEQNSNIVVLPPLQTLADSGALRRQSNRPKNRPKTAPPAAPSQEHLHRFEYRGRTLTIYRRGESWYFRIQRAGQVRKIRLGNVTLRAAVIAARRVAEAADLRRFDLLDTLLKKPATAPAPAPQNVPNIGQLCSRFLQLNHVAGRTAANYVACLRRILATTHPTADVDALPVTALCRDTAGKWFAAAEASAAAAADQQKGNRIKRTANSTYQQAYCVVCPAAVERLRATGLELPVLDFKRSILRASAPDYRPPDPAIIRRTLRDWLRLPRNEFLAVGLELAAGLRKGEVAQARWGWLQPGRVHGPARVKNGTGEVDVTPINPFWRLLRGRIRREGWTGAPDDYLIAGQASERTHRVFERIGRWMRGLGWQTQKTNHAFRAYAGGMVALKYDIFRAQLFLRHSTVTVTEQNYGHFLRAQRAQAFNPRKIRVQWVKIIA